MSKLKIPTIKNKNGFAMPVLAFGTWGYGGYFEPDLKSSKAFWVNHVKKVLDQGLTHLEVGELYAQGYTEEIVGEAIKSYNRKDLMIDVSVDAIDMGYPQIVKRCHDSLKRLGIECIDTYFLHTAPLPETPLESIVKGLNELLETGKIKNIAVSNFCWQDIDVLKKELKKPILYAFAHYNLIFREPEKSGLLEYCQKNDIFLACARPLQPNFEYSETNLHPLYEKGHYPILDSMAEKYNKTNAQIAFNWLLHQKNVFVFSKVTSEKHLQEFIESSNFKISDSDFENLKNNFPVTRNVSDRVPLMPVLSVKDKEMINKKNITKHTKYLEKARKEKIG